MAGMTFSPENQVQQFPSNRREILRTSLLLDYLVKYVRVFWYRKNFPIYGQFLTI